jgi:hypothetical protein
VQHGWVRWKERRRCVVCLCVCACVYMCILDDEIAAQLEDGSIGVYLCNVTPMRADGDWMGR